MEKQKERLSNFELLRIVSMFLIVLWHTIIHSGSYSSATGFLKFMLEFIACFCCVHVNSLVLLTGYFQCYKKNINKEKIVSLLGKVWFYKVLFLFIFLFIGIEQIGHIKIFEELLPIDLNNYWFINNYLVLFFLIPYLNKLLEQLSQKEHKNLLIILVVLLSIIPIFTNQKTIFNDGYTVFHFVLLYFIGAYLRKYPIKDSYHLKNLSIIKYKLLLLFMFTFFIFLHFILYYFGDSLTHYNKDLLTYFGHIIQSAFLKYSSPVAIILSVIYFLIFDSINIKSKLINMVAATTFGIYLIHDNAFVRAHIYDLFHIKSVVDMGSTSQTLFLIVISAITIFISCIFIEKFRMIIFSFAKSKISFKKG